MSTIIKIDKVSKAFLRRVILKDVSLSVEAGHTVGIVGSNGSGKSVLFQIICYVHYIPCQRNIFN